MVFRSGKISMELVSEAGVVILEHEGSDGNGLSIDVPRDWMPDTEHFTRWCCRFLGMVMADQPIFTVKGKVHGMSDGTVEVYLHSCSEQAQDNLSDGDMLALVPEAKQ